MPPENHTQAAFHKQRNHKPDNSSRCTHTHTDTRTHACPKRGMRGVRGMGRGNTNQATKTTTKHVRSPQKTAHSSDAVAGRSADFESRRHAGAQRTDVRRTDSVGPPSQRRRRRRRRMAWRRGGTRTRTRRVAKLRTASAAEWKTAPATGALERVSWAAHAQRPCAAANACVPACSGRRAGRFDVPRLLRDCC